MLYIRLGMFFFPEKDFSLFSIRGMGAVTAFLGKGKGPFGPFS